MAEFEKIPLPGSHLSFRFDPPSPDKHGTPCFVFLHGFGSDQTGEKAEYFRKKAVEQGYAFCALDFQGHGKSGGTMRELTISRNLCDLEAVHEVLRQRGCSKIVLLGSSMGGFTGIWYAARHPEEVTAGCHIAPAFGMAEGFLAWAGSEGATKWEKEGRIFFENDFVHSELGWEWIKDLRSFDTKWLQQNYRTPTLILQGKKDDSVPWRGVVDFAAECEFEGIDLHFFADGDHRLTDRKDRLWALSEEFLRGRGIL